jgi:hypothetical protein
MPPRGWALASASSLRALLGAFALAGLACGGDDPCDSVAGPAVVAQVDLSPDDPGVPLGTTLQLQAVPRSACGNPVEDAQVAWTTSAPGVASVTASGMVTGEGIGTADITATSEGVSSSVTVTVRAPDVVTVEVAPDQATIAVGETLALTATARDADGDVLTGRTVTWSSDDETVASVTAAGVVEGESPGGPVTITATIEGVSGTAAIAVRPGPPVRLAFRVQPSDVEAGEEISPAVEVVILDADGNQTADERAVTITLADNPGGASLDGTTTRDADNGVATFANLRLNRPGTGYRLGASAEGLTGATSDPFAVAAGAVASLDFTVQPVDGTAGLPLAPVVVTLRDSEGNVAVGATAPVTVSLGTNPTDAPLQGTLTVAPVAGVATFTDLRVDVAAAGYRLSAEVAGSEPEPSAAFTIRPGTPVKLRFISPTPNPREDRDIEPPVQVAVSDAWDNTVPVGGTPVTISLGENPVDANLAGTTTRFTVAGVATFGNLEITRSGSGFTLRATSFPLAAAETEPFTVRN